MADKLRSMIGEGTLLPLSLVVTIVAQTLGGYIWLERRFSEMERQLYELRYQQRERWTVGDQRAWSGALAVANRDLRVPEVHQVEPQP